MANIQQTTTGTIERQKSILEEASKKSRLEQAVNKFYFSNPTIYIDILSNTIWFYTLNFIES